MRLATQGGPAALVLTILAAGAAAGEAPPKAPPAGLAAFKPIVDLRLREESVDQDGLPEDAHALVLRARLGVEAPKVAGTTLLIEGDFLWPLHGDYRADPSAPVMTAYPVVADADTHEMNRLQLTNTSLPGTTVTLGRQRINLDDTRFVGNVGWRMNEQTFDGLRVVNRSLKPLTVDLAYVNQVNRVFGRKSPQGRFEGDTFLGNVAWQFGPGKLTAFAYLVAFDPLAGVPAAVRDSSATYGLRFAGERAIGKGKVAYVASYATQEDHGENPLSFDLDYWLAEVTGTRGAFSLGAGYEVLEGDGAKGFSTPLATLHRFQGWADKFLATPANGIEDRYLTAGWSMKSLGPFDTLQLTAAWHDFGAERIPQDYGSEWNLQAQVRYRRFTGLLKFADYRADGLFTDTRKLWVQVEFAF
jgi:hypothetical protein